MKGLKKVIGFIVALFFVFGAILLMFYTSGGKPIYAVDTPIIVLFILVVVPLLFVTGMAGDFGRAWKIAFGKKDYPLAQLKNASNACSFITKLIFVDAALQSFIGLHSMLNCLEDISSLRANLAVAVLPFFYALIFTLCTLTLKAAVDRKINQSESL